MHPPGGAAHILSLPRKARETEGILHRVIDNRISLRLHGELRADRLQRRLIRQEKHVAVLMPVTAHPKRRLRRGSAKHAQAKLREPSGKLRAGTDMNAAMLSEAFPELRAARRLHRAAGWERIDKEYRKPLVRRAQHGLQQEFRQPLRIRNHQCAVAARSDPQRFSVHARASVAEGVCRNDVAVELRPQERLDRKLERHGLACPLGLGVIEHGCWRKMRPAAQQMAHAVCIARPDVEIPPLRIQSPVIEMRRRVRVARLG